MRKKCLFLIHILIYLKGLKVFFFFSQDIVVNLAFFLLTILTGFDKNLFIGKKIKCIYLCNLRFIC